MRRLALIAALGVLALAAAPAAAQSLRVSADSRDIYAGLPFTLQIAASGFDKDPQPKAPELAIDGAEVSFLGASPQVSRSISIFNGRRSESVEVTFVYHYRVTPGKAGRYQIPALTVTQGKKRARSRSASFVAKDVPTSGDMALRVEMPDRPVWLGETFEVFIDWYVARDPSQPSFNIPLFERGDWVDIRAPDGAGRRTISFPAGDDSVELGYSSDQADLDGRHYTRLRFRALATPLRAGTLELEAPQVVAGLQVERGFFGGRSELFSASGKPSKLVVKALPQSGRPAAFRNAVGSGFSIDVEASRTVVRVGDPIELAIKIRGDGPLAGVALPDLSASLAPEHFDLPDEEPVGELSEDGKEKTFRVTARLKSAEAREVPPIELPYFDPETATYKTARSQPIALQVAGSAMVGASQVTRAVEPGGHGGGQGAKARELVGADLSISEPSETLERPARPGDLAPLLGGLYAVPFLALVGLWWRRRTRDARDDRSALRARRREVGRLLAEAESRPGKEVASPLAAALRALAREVGAEGEARRDLDAVIADLEATAYNPRAGGEPLDAALRDRCRDAAEALASRAQASGGNGRPNAAALAVLLAAAIGGAGVARAEGDAPLLDQARSAYRQALATDAGAARVKGFAAAARLFGRAVSEHPGRPALLADWGNASLGARELGWAALAFRRALVLDPGSARARRNLEWVRRSLPDWAPTPESRGAIDSLLFWHHRLTVAQRHLGAAIAFAIAAVLLLPWGKGRERWLRRAAVIPALAFVALLTSALFEPDRSAEAVVVADATALRSADSAGAPEALDRPLPAGLEVEVLDGRDRWVKVSLADGRSGWLPRGAIERVEPL